MSTRGWALAIALLPVIHADAAVIVAEPGDAGLRAAIAAAQPGDTVMVASQLTLESTVRIDKPLTVRVDPTNAWRASIYASFDGVMFQLVGKGIVFEWVRLYGSPLTDGLDISGAEGPVILRDCVIASCYRPVLDGGWESLATLRLERVNASWNRSGLGAFNLEATDSVFSFNDGTGVGAYKGTFDRCRIENNKGDGMGLTYGTVKNSVFRYNSDLGLRFDPDPGVLSLIGCLFYANAGGGLLLREEAFATVDNCTFTRHTGPPAVLVTEAHDVLFRHCTITDNVFIRPEYWHYREGGALAISDAGRVELQNCLVADNPTNGSPHAAGIALSFPEDNWIDGGGNVIGGPAYLSPLSDNGGPTLSLLPLPGSPAIDAGRASDISTDARGLSRVAGAAPDAGAIEAGAGPVADSDTDGLSDIWESFYDLDPNNAGDASSDQDGDGRTALAEFHSGTDPNDARSVHRVNSVTISLSPSEQQPALQVGYLTWNFARNVTYEVETSTDLREWRKLREPPFLSRDDDGRFILLLQLFTDSPIGFYRVVVK